MEQNQKPLGKKRVAIVGGGPAGVFAALYASSDSKNDVFIFEKNEVLKTILPTGGGRCNLAYEEFDFKELAKNYPRGEKFLYSVFSRFATKDTIEFFKNIGVKTYTQADSRIFPLTNSSQTIQDSLTKELKKRNVSIKKEKVVSVVKTGEKFTIETQNDKYNFDALILATGGKGLGHRIAQSFGHNIIDLKPALTSLKIKEKYLFELSGLSLQNITAKVAGAKKKPLPGDLLFTHYGISGPLTYKISSYSAYEEFNAENPLKISFNFVGKTFEEFDSLFNDDLKSNAKKDIANVLDNYIPRRLSDLILQKEKIDPQIKAGQLSKIDRVKLSNKLTNFEVNATTASVGEEIVTAGGVDLKEVNPKTMESKIISNLYFCGEILDIDGLTGGFNLQNCWSSGFIAGGSV